MKRVILHSDMNACFASIEQKLDPSLRGKAMAVAGDPKNRNGIILAKSEEAKKMGVKTAMPIWEAKTKCRDLILVPPQYDEYLKHSKMAKKIYYDYTNQVESFGLDECFLDVSGSLKLFGSPIDIAEEISHRMKDELGLTVSIGISFCKVFAKLGSDMKKPDAITVIGDDWKDIVWPLPVRKMLGIGRATERKLNRMGIFNLGELARAPEELLRLSLGVNGTYLHSYANGKDTRPVVDINYRDDIKTIGNSSTCRQDLVDDREVKKVLKELSFSVSRRLREAGLEARGVEVFVRDTELFSRTYQRKFSLSTQSSIILADKAYELFKEKYTWEKNIRAVGIRAINLVKEGHPGQLDVFLDYEDQEKSESCDKAIYDIRKKYGKDIISFAGLKGDIKLPEEINEIITLPARHYNS